MKCRMMWLMESNSAVASWEDLPDNLFISILERLELLDYLQFSLVCKSWNFVAKNSIIVAKMMSSYNRPPMLLISSSTKKGSNTWNVYNAMNNKVLDLQLEMPNKRFCGSSKGWLIVMEKNFAVTLINPFFRVKGMRKKENSIIHLPPLVTEMTRPDNWGRRFEYFSFRSTISADPILDAANCIVAVIYEDKSRLAFIRLSEDTRWTYIDESWSLLHDVAIVQGQTCYTVGGDSSQLLSLNISTQMINSTQKRKKKNDKCYSDVECVAPAIRHRQQSKHLIKKYLVDVQEKELLLVHRYISYTHETGQETTKFEVFELDFDKFRWKKKHTLGDAALFLGQNSSVAVTASHFSKCRPNHIYFNHDHCRLKREFEHCDYGVYNVTDQSFYFGEYKFQNKRLSTLLKETDRPPIWVVPSLQI